MSDEIKNAIDSLIAGDASSFRGGIYSALAQKLVDRLEIEKAAIGGSMYSEDTREESDENDKSGDDENNGGKK